MLEELTTTNEEDMATVPKLGELNGRQLQKLIEDAQELQKERRSGRLQELRQKWKSEADEEGFTIQEVLGLNSARKAKGDGTRSPARIKYKAPDGTPFAGKGRIPHAFRKAFTANKVEGWNSEDATFDTPENRKAAFEPYLIDG